MACRWAGRSAARAGAGAVGPVGYHLKHEDLKKGVSYVEDIRKTVGDKMEICIEGHARWNLTDAVKIARALEPYDIMWLEEIMPPDNVESYARLKHDTKMPLCVSERLDHASFGFREVIEKNAADIIMPDMAWSGGITETRKICAHGRNLSAADHQPRLHRPGGAVVGRAPDAAHSQRHDHGDGARLLRGLVQRRDDRALCRSAMA